jgi:hypothetical protein
MDPAQMMRTQHGARGRRFIAKQEAEDFMFALPVTLVAATISSLISAVELCSQVGRKARRSPYLSGFAD